MNEPSLSLVAAMDRKRGLRDLKDAEIPTYMSLGRKVSEEAKNEKSIKIIVIHYTGIQSGRESLNRLCNPKFQVSSHFFINEKGKVYRLVDDNKIAWHAGKSCWGKYRNLNKNWKSNIVEEKLKNKLNKNTVINRACINSKEIKQRKLPKKLNY